MKPHWLLSAVLGVIVIALTGCGSSNPQTDKRLQNLEATVAAIQKQLAQTPTAAATSFPPITAAVSSPPSPSSIPTATVTATSTPSTASVAPASGTVLYQADWSQGLQGWRLAPGWQLLRGALITDGSTRESDFSEPPFNPSSMGLMDYAVEAEIQVIKPLQDGGCGSFGVIARTDVNAGINTWCKLPSRAQISAGPQRTGGDAMAQNRFDSGPDWHTYRLEVNGNHFRFKIDGSVVVEATDNRYLSSGHVGVWATDYQVTVRAFRVIAL